MTDRTEWEIEELRADVVRLTDERDHFFCEYKDAIAAINRQIARAERQSADVARLKDERDHFFYEHKDAIAAIDRQIARAEAAERQRDALDEAVALKDAALDRIATLAFLNVDDTVDVHKYRRKEIQRLADKALSTTPVFARLRAAVVEAAIEEAAAENILPSDHTRNGKIAAAVFKRRDAVAALLARQRGEGNDV